MADKNINLGNSSTTVNVEATGKIVGTNIKSKGSATQPVYFDANGVAQNTTYTLGKSVPSDAKFTDTIVQSDWNQTTTTADDYIKNKPTIPAAANNGNLIIYRNEREDERDYVEFSANSSEDVEYDLMVPCYTSDLINDSGFVENMQYNTLANSDFEKINKLEDWTLNGGAAFTAGTGVSLTYNSSITSIQYPAYQGSYKVFVKYNSGLSRDGIKTITINEFSTWNNPILVTDEIVENNQRFRLYIYRENNKIIFYTALDSGTTTRTYTIKSVCLTNNSSASATGYSLNAKDFGALAVPEATYWNVGSNGINPYCLFAQTSDGTYESFVLSSSTENTKSVNPHAFLPDKKIYLNPTGNAYTHGNSSVFSALEQSDAFNYEYSFNIASSTSFAQGDSYIKWTYNNGLLYLASDWLATSLPTSFDGYIYQKIGSFTNGHNGSLVSDNQYYIYDYLYGIKNWNSCDYNENLLFCGNFLDNLTNQIGWYVSGNANLNSIGVTLHGGGDTPSFYTNYSKRGDIGLSHYKIITVTLELAQYNNLKYRCTKSVTMALEDSSNAILDIGIPNQPLNINLSDSNGIKFYFANPLPENFVLSEISDRYTEDDFGYGRTDTWINIVRIKIEEGYSFTGFGTNSDASAASYLKHNYVAQTTTINNKEIGSEGITLTPSDIGALSTSAGGTVTGNVAVTGSLSSTAGLSIGTTSSSSEIDLVCRSSTGNIYLYSSPTNATRGIYSANANGQAVAPITVSSANVVSLAPNSRTAGNFNVYVSASSTANPLFLSVNADHGTVSVPQYLDLYSSTQGVVRCRKNGTEWATCQGKAFSNQSSIKYKKNVTDMSEEEAKGLLKLRPVNYDYKVEENGTNCSGFIAEEVNEIMQFPVISIDGEVDSLDYSKFVPSIVKLCQMQQAQIDELKKEVERLKIT